MSDIFLEYPGFHEMLFHDLGALASSLLESTVNIAKFSKKVHEIAQHTKNPKRLFKIWGEIEDILDTKNKAHKHLIGGELAANHDLVTIVDQELVRKLRELKHVTHSIFAWDSAKRSLKNKIAILVPLFTCDVVFADKLTYALPVLHPMFFVFGMHLAYKASKESHEHKEAHKHKISDEKDPHHGLTYGEIIDKNDRSHKLAMLEIASVLTIYTAGLPRDQQAAILGAFSTVMIASDLVMTAIPRVELLGDDLANNGRNPATRLMGRSMQQSGEFIIEKAIPFLALRAEYILAGRALTHSSLYVEQQIEEGLKFVSENYGVILEYAANLGITGLVGFGMSPVATAIVNKALVPIHKGLSKTELYRTFSAASRTVFQSTASAKKNMQRNVKNVSYGALMKAMLAVNPEELSAQRAMKAAFANRPAYYSPSAAPQDIFLA